MKSVTRGSAAVALGLLLGFSSSLATAQGGGADFTKIVADTGLVTLGPSQVLRLTVVNSSGADDVHIRFRSVAYDTSCSGPVCQHAVQGQTLTGPMTLAQGAGASLEIPRQPGGVRAVVTSNDRDVKVLAAIVDANTNQIIVVCIA